MKLTFSLLFLLISVTVFAQMNMTNPDEGNIISFRTTSTDWSVEDVEGSPYFDEEFNYGQVLVNGEKKLTGNLRYNAYNSEIELQKNEKEYSALLKRGYISALIGDKLYKLYSYKDESINNIRTGYFNPLNEGKIKLLYKPEMKLRRGKAAATSYDRTVAPRFIDVSSYYIKKGEDPAEELFLNKRELFKFLEADNETKKFVKAEDLNLRETKDVLILLNFFNSQKYSEDSK